MLRFVISEKLLSGTGYFCRSPLEYWTGEAQSVSGGDQVSGPLLQPSASRSFCSSVRVARGSTPFILALWLSLCTALDCSLFKPRFSETAHFLFLVLSCLKDKQPGLGGVELWTELLILDARALLDGGWLEEKKMLVLDPLRFFGLEPWELNWQKTD